MKFIGQYIQSLIARFRNDVYLEDLAESAQDHVVGIDAAGKLYKQDVSTGDITGVTITTDSGGGSAASDTGGSADFSILGSSGVNVTNSGTTITAVSVPAEIDHDSLLNFVAAEHYRWDNDISGTATIHANNITDLHGAGVNGSANQLLTDDGDGTVTSESFLTFSGTILGIGSTDGTNYSIAMPAHDDGVGGSLAIKAGSATAGNGVNDQAGGDLQMYAGGSTGNSFGGAIEFYSSTRTGGGNDTANNVGKICEISTSTESSLLSLYSYDGSNYVTTDSLAIKVSPSGSTEVITTDSDGHEGDFSVVADGEINLQAYEGDNINFKVTDSTSGATQTIGTLQKARFQLQGTSGSASMLELFEDTANGTNGVRLQATDNMASSRIITLPDATGTVLLKDNVNPGKQFQVFQCNFIDDLGTSEVFLPIHGTTFEASQVYQDDVAILAPCDGRIVSVDFNCMSLTGDGNLTITIYTLGPNSSGTSLSSWTSEETETVAVQSTDDSHVFHFAFDNAKHFESTEKFVLSIQADTDVTANTYMYATVVVEFDYSTLLGSSSAEFDSVP